MSTILVTGGTGNLGALVAARLRDRGHEVRVLSRRAPRYPVDLRDGTGLDAALAGAEVVVHCASSPRGGDDTAARHLVAAARRAGTVGNLVYVSIVGVDVVPLGYYRTKLRVERLLEESGLGVTVLRATQFHDLVARIVGAAARLPVMPLPKDVRVQPIAVGEVADRLADLAVPTPAGRVPDMGGPEIRTLPDLARTYLAATSRTRRIVPLPLTGRIHAALRQGANLTPSHAVGRGTFAEFMAGRGR
ncbi:SDR family oxidoreductase [Streptomyces subrutilus]|uniref:NAD-dependent epimerase/dehydratase family protein n=1 Tax=Streptomyces subrutilus TaxID=36818 RepID=A0A5P2UQW0_9ACTN|nr:NAD(P)H-binding protein [Streptomyces subrutilus]QEU81513.1 NAD-dependent epimerase/dehydratase family protein [Streptomyces subrutilus]WSJ29150.1 NAD(P)H-binding protein [Streptomyces subrutilus]GGZ88134.1 nucleotide-diphosphate-sugar epimerase [Streptomyces subrutilus]